MDKLPQELIDQICGYLQPADLFTTYYVSHKFRAAAEEHAATHRTSSIELTPNNKQWFKKRYSNFRLRYIQKIGFHTYFPDLYVWNDDYTCRETVAQQREKDELFTQQIRDLFSTLKAAEDKASERNTGKYKLIIYVPSQRRASDLCVHNERPYWRTHLLNPETLPLLNSVQALEISGQFTTYTCHVIAKLDYRVLIDLVTRCPNIEELECHMGIGEWNVSYSDEPRKLVPCDYDGPRRDSRHSFGDAVVAANIPPSLRRVELDFICRDALTDAESIQHWTRLPNLVSPAVKDPFSTALRLLSYNLQELTIRAQVDGSLFWPDDGSQSTPTWPNLQRLFIMFHMASPSGAYYFRGPRGEGAELTGHKLSSSSYPPLEMTDEDEAMHMAFEERSPYSDGQDMFFFRVAPDSKTLLPFLTCFKKAVLQMPKLVQAVLWCPLQWDVGGSDDYNPEEWFYYELPPELTRFPDYLAWGVKYCRSRPDEPFETEDGRDLDTVLKEWDREERGNEVFLREGFEFWTADE